MTAETKSTGAPLVEPGPALTPEEVRRYSHHLLVPEIGESGQRRLKAARVLVVGAGGLGSPALLYLAAAGVGTIGILDDDVVDESNLHRQVVHGTADVGRAKVDSAADALARANPLVTVVRHRQRMTADNAADLVAGYDLVLDGADNFGTRYLVNDACVLAGLPWVWGAVLRFDGHVAVFWDGRGPTYRDLFPQPPAPGTVPSCSQAGVLGAVVAQVGSVMVTEALKLITGAGRPLLGRVLVLDALEGTWRTLGVRQDPTRAPITAVVAEAEACAVEPSPATVPTVDARSLAGELDHGRVVLIDVREPDEHADLAIPGARLVPLAALLEAAESGKSALADVPRNADVVLHCASGARSERGAQALIAAGWTHVRHLDGGITAWASATGLVTAGN